jgi:hypothetical protein
MLEAILLRKRAEESLPPISPKLLTCSFTFSYGEETVGVNPFFSVKKAILQFSRYRYKEGYLQILSVTNASFFFFRQGKV